MIKQNFTLIFKSRLILPPYCVCAKIWEFSAACNTQLIDDNDYARLIQKVANGEEKRRRINERKFVN